MRKHSHEAQVKKADLVYERQQKLKSLLLRVQNGGVIQPVIFEIEQLYQTKKEIKPNGS